MAYSDKVIEHYENPRNVGTLDKNDENVGTGLVGAPACGDVMRLQIKVSDDGIIEDAKFKTFGCLGSNTPIATPAGYRDVSWLRPGDVVWAWDGKQVVEGKVREVIRRKVHWTRLLRVQFDQARVIFCTDDHVWWSADNRPLLASEMTAGMELLSLTQRELRGLNNVGRRPWLRDANSARMHEQNKTLDHSKLPQNQRGFQQSEAARKKKSETSKKLWQNENYAVACLRAMHGAATRRPTNLERSFLDLFEANDVDARYVGDGSFWVNGPNGERLNPDFKVNGQRKLIEVYTDKMPEFMQNRATTGWMVEKKAAYAAAGFDCMFLDIKELDRCLDDVQRFIHNGIPVRSIQKIEDKRGLRGLEREGDEVVVYDLVLEEGAHCFFVQRAMSHNCGSAIASSSLATEWLKGKSVEEAETIKNSMIAEELNLPPVKIHCSVLAEDAIKSAIADYRRKQAEKKALQGG
jgi:NifU-like protein involved in Fe-S cluster formation